MYKSDQILSHQQVVSDEAKYIKFLLDPQQDNICKPPHKFPLRTSICSTKRIYTMSGVNTQLFISFEAGVNGDKGRVLSNFAAPANTTLTLAAQAGSFDRSIEPPATFSSVEGVASGASAWRTIGGSITLRYVGRADEQAGCIDYAEGVANYSSEPLQFDTSSLTGSDNFTTFGVGQGLKVCYVPFDSNSLEFKNGVIGADQQTRNHYFYISGMVSGSFMRVEVEIFWEYVPDVRTVRLLNPTFGILKENPLEKPQVRQIVEDK